MEDACTRREVDWPGLQHLVEQSEYERFISCMQEYMQHKSNHFKYMKDGIQLEILDKINNEAAASLLTGSLALLLDKSQPSQSATISSHLILELMVDNINRQAAEGLKPEAVQLFAKCCSVEKAKLAAKVAPLFFLTCNDLPSELDLHQYIKKLLDDPNLFTPGIGLLIHFPEFLQYFDIRSLFSRLLMHSHETLGDRLASCLDENGRIQFIEECLLQNKMKIASSSVRKFDLMAKYPYVEHQYKEMTLEKLLDKSLWGPAVTFAGEEKLFQETVVKRMAAEGQMLMAQQYAAMLNLPESIVDIDPQILKAEAAIRASKYQQLAIPFENVIFVDTDVLALEAGPFLKEAAAIGIDVEWRPDAKGEKSKASILQIGLKDCVYIFDLLSLGTSPSLTIALQSCLSSTTTLVIGFGVREDLNRLAWSYPGQTCFRSVCGVVDLQELWHPYSVKNRIQTITGKQTAGLSHVAERVLGKPVDKSMQVSNWGMRPLAEAQLKYAAQDAHILLLLYDLMIDNKDDGLGPDILDSFMYSFNSASAHTPTTKIAEEEASTGADYPRDKKMNRFGASPSGDEGILPEQKLNLETKFDARNFGQVGQRPQRIADRLQEFGLAAAFHWLFHNKDMSSCKDAASALGVGEAQVAKSIALSSVKGSHWLVVLEGNCRVDLNKVAKEIGTKRRKVRFATEKECLEVFGYSPGTMPPFAHANSNVQVLVDTCLEEQFLVHGALWCGSGMPNGIISLSFQELLQVSGGKVVDIKLQTQNGHKEEGISTVERLSSMPNPNEASAAQVKLTLDTMLGRLCRWLRALGVDTEILPQGTQRESIPKLSELAMSSGRMFLTRNYGLATRKDCGLVYLLGSDDCEDQLREISAHFGIKNSLHHLVWANDLEALKSLLESGAETNGIDSESGWTPLHKALYFGHVRCAAALLEHGACQEIKDPHGFTALELLSRELIAVEQLKPPVPGAEGAENLQADSADLDRHFPGSKPRSEVYTWGNGANYQLGTGSADVISLPRRVASLSSLKVKKLAASKFHTVALTQNGEVYTWGWGRGGRLGHEELSAGNKDAAQIYPRIVKGLKGSNVIDIAAAKHHTLVVTTMGEVFSWGSNKDGKLGYQSVDTQPVPRKVIALKGVMAEAVSAANRHSVVLVNGGLVYTWGANRYGQLGYGTSHSVSNPTPRPVESVQHKSICQVSTSKRHTLVLTKNGEVFSWGHTFVNPNKVRFRVHRSSFKTSSGNEIWFHRGYEDVCRPKVVRIAAGVFQSACITRNGTVLVWNSASPDPEVVSVEGSLAGKSAVSIGSGKRLMVVVGEVGDIHTWETPTVDGTASKSMIARPTPKRIDITIRAVDVWVGEKHVVALQQWQPSYECLDTHKPHKMQEQPASTAPSSTTTTIDQIEETQQDGDSFTVLAGHTETETSPSQEIPKLQDICERTVAEHVLTPRNALQLLAYADSVGATCLRRHALRVTVLNLDLVLAQESKHLRYMPLHLLYEIERSYQTSVLGIDLRVNTPPWWLKDSVDQEDVCKMGRRPTLLSRFTDENEFLSGENLLQPQIVPPISRNCLNRNGFQESGFMVDSRAPPMDIRAKLERNIKKKLQQIAGLEARVSQGQILDSQQQSKLSRKKKLEHGLHQLRAGSSIYSVQCLISGGVYEGSKGKILKTFEGLGSVRSSDDEFGKPKSSGRDELTGSGNSKNKKKIDAASLKKTGSTSSRKIISVEEPEQVFSSVGFSVAADTCAQVKENTRVARSKGRKGGLSAFLSGQLEKSDSSLEANKLSEGRTWATLSMPSQQPMLKDIMHREKPVAKEIAGHVAKGKPPSSSGVSLDDFMPRPTKPRKQGPAWGGMQNTPPSGEVPSIPGIQNEQGRRTRSNFVKMGKVGSQGRNFKNRWYIPEEPEVQDLRSIQFEEHICHEMSGTSQRSTGKLDLLEFRKDSQ